VVAVDVNAERLDRLRALFPPQKAEAAGVRLEFLDVSEVDARTALLDLTDQRGYDDVVVFAANAALVETGDAVLARDGCLNFFAGPVDRSFTAGLNLYNIHYESTHVVGTSGGSRSDMEESLELSASGSLNPSMMVTHVGGLGAAPDALMNLDTFTGGKILIYPHIDLELTAIADLAGLAQRDVRFGPLAEIMAGTGDIWNQEAEEYVLATFAHRSGADPESLA
jgi:L-sorbose 1-phosphate reductase